MTNILIVDLQNHHDLIHSSQTAFLLKKENKNSDIYLFASKEMKGMTQLFSSIKKTFTIDKKKLLRIERCSFVSNTYAIEFLSKELEPITRIKWNHIINNSPTPFASYLTSYIHTYSPQASLSGVRCSSKKKFIFSNEWTIFFDNTMETYPYTPLHIMDCHLKSNNLKFSENLSQALIVKEQKDQELTKLKINRPSAYVVGIEIFRSQGRRTLSLNEIKKLLLKLQENPEIIPVLLSDKKRKDLEMISLEHELTSPILTNDLVELPSTLLQLDLLITADGYVKDLADILDRSIIELSFTNSLNFRRSVRNSKSYILSCRSKDKQTNDPFVQVSDILQVIDLQRNLKDITMLSLSEYTAIYKPIVDELGVNYSLRTGHASIKEEMKRNFARFYLTCLLNIKNRSKILRELQRFLAPQVKNILELEINSTSSLAKETLTAIRNFKEFLGHKNLKHIKHSLKRIDSYASKAMISSLPALIFKSKIISIQEENIIENFMEIECSLYELKNDLYRLHHILSETYHLLPDITVGLSKIEKANL